MSDYTIDDSMAKIIYEIGDREIYNDIRAEIGVQHSETVIDADPTYSWRQWEARTSISPGGFHYSKTFYADAQNAIKWELADVWAASGLWGAYYDYQCIIKSSGASSCVVEAWNTGERYCNILAYTIKYKYKATDRITHDEISYQILTVRVTDDASIAKYGRRVMNLAWPQGTDKEDMETIANACLARYKDPVPNLTVSIQGKNDTIATAIFTREISDIISVVCPNMGMISTDFFLDKISMRDYPTQIPSCTWLLTGQRPGEATGYFRIDTDLIDGAKLIAGSVGYFVIDTDSINGNKLIA